MWGLWLVFLAFPLFGFVADEALGRDRAVSADGLTAAPLPVLLNPLAPPETGSPRDTLKSFLSETAEASALLQEALLRHRSEPGFFPSEEVEAQIDEVRALLLHAARTFDLSHVPRATLGRFELESVLLMMEILDRLPEIDLEQAPDREKIGANPMILGYTLPGTEIRIALDESHPYPRRYLFDAETVSRLPEFYNRIKDLPKREAGRPDLYQAYSISPGELLPSKWFWLVMALPDWFRTVYDDQAIWQWIGLAFAIVLTGLASTLIVRRKRLRGGRFLFGRLAARLLTPLLLLAVSVLFNEVVDGVINITGDLSWWIDIGLDVFATMVAIWIVLVLANFVAEWLISSPRVGPDSLDASLLRVCFRLIGVLAGAVVLAYGAYSIGLPVVGVVAGLGVGGFALALAVKPTLENFIGFIILYSDRPVRVGERCRIGDLDGVVESIGIRSTRLRAHDGTKIIIQNADFAQMRLMNLESRNLYRLREVLRLSPESERAQISELLDAIAGRLKQEPGVEGRSVEVTFRGIGAYSLDIEIDACVETETEEAFKRVRGNLLLEVIRLVESVGTHLAFLPAGLLPRDGEQGAAAYAATADEAKKKADREAEDAWKRTQASQAQQRADLF